MLLIRIQNNGLDRNGNKLNKVFIYKKDGKEFKKLGTAELKNTFEFGNRVNKDGSVTTQLSKDEILKRCKGEDLVYISE